MSDKDKKYFSIILETGRERKIQNEIFVFIWIWTAQFLTR